MKKSIQVIIFLSLAAAIPFWLAAPLPAQDKESDNMQMLREKIKADKKLLIAENMDLTESEAKNFWPVYEQYQKDLGAIYQRIGKLIESYANDYDADTMTDERARQHAEELLNVEQENGTLGAAYLQRLNEVLPPKKVARFLQLENKIQAVVLYQLAINVPIIE